MTLRDFPSSHISQQAFAKYLIIEAKSSNSSHDFTQMYIVGHSPAHHVLVFIIDCHSLYRFVAQDHTEREHGRLC